MILNRFRIFAILAVCWMAVIFAFSAKDADESTKESNRITDLIGRIVYDDYDNLSEEKKQEFIDKTDHIVRKTAHSTEYALLGILLVNAGLGLKNKKKRTVAGISFSIASAYAASDEIHQLFVPGRAGMVTDWMIDSVGAAVGIILVLLAGRVLKAVKGGKHEHNTCV